MVDELDRSIERIARQEDGPDGIEPARNQGDVVAQRALLTNQFLDQLAILARYQEQLRKVVGVMGLVVLAARRAVGVAVVMRRRLRDMVGEYVETMVIRPQGPVGILFRSINSSFPKFLRRL
jgi:hypothetical protein